MRDVRGEGARVSDMSRPDALSTPGARVAAAGVLVSAVLSYRGRQSAGCRAVRGRRACRVRRGRLGGQTGCVGGVGRVPKASEVEVGHSEPWIETLRLSGVVFGSGAHGKFGEILMCIIA